MIIIFSNFNQRAIIAFARTLENNDVDYAIIAASDNDTILNTSYNKNVLSIRKKDQLDVEDILQSIEIVKQKREVDSCIIAPSTEALNRFLLKNRDLFENNKITIPLVTKELYELISDKYSFGHLCREHNISIPEEYSRINEIKIPFVAKPYKYFNNESAVFAPQLIYTNNDKDKFIKNFNCSDFYYQRFITGKSYYLLYYIDKQQTIYKYSQENIVQQPDGKSIVAAISSNIHQEPISSLFENMLKLIKFRGLIMIEIKEENGQYYMIEANPRFWGPSQLFVDSGVNLFECFLFDYGIIGKKPIFKPNNTKYFWYGGIIQTLKNNGKLTVYSDILSKAPIEDWIKIDIYNRDDTAYLLNNEL
jgi:predicted ATP-grasp superfamily ATP-dependent carboligase